MSGTAYEDNGHITLGLYNGYKGNITLRMAISDLSMYYFYPYTNTDLLPRHRRATSAPRYARAKR